MEYESVHSNRIHNKNIKLMNVLLKKMKERQKECLGIAINDLKAANEYEYYLNKTTGKIQREYLQEKIDKLRG